MSSALESPASFNRYLDRLVAAEAEHCQHGDTAVHRARAATVRRFAAALPVSPVRVRAYFRTCSRRAAIRHGGIAGSRMLLEAVVSDMRAGGRSAEDIWAELVRGWADSVPADVLEEYRVRLSARVA